jgi:hypothetical protein
LGWEDRPTGRKWELQSDSNSFDFVSCFPPKKPAFLFCTREFSMPFRISFH